jgi:pyrroline-5-carboxylate reductase
MTALSSLRIAFIGGGNMTRGLLGGLLARGADPARITVTAASDATRAALAHELGVRTTADNFAAAAAAQVVVLAVKPQVMGEVTRALAPVLRAAAPLVISVAAGIRTSQLRTWIDGGALDARVPLVRAMPNRPALLGAGATGLFADAATDSPGRALAAELLGCTGLALWVEREDDLDLVTALSGSGPAYFFRLAELMAEAGAARGLEPGIARQLAARTLVGAGRMVDAEATPDLAAMRDAVTSRGGTTAAALECFDAAGLPAVVAAAMDAAVARSRELSRQYGDAGE